MALDCDGQKRNFLGRQPIDLFDAIDWRRHDILALISNRRQRHENSSAPLRAMEQRQGGGAVTKSHIRR